MPWNEPGGPGDKDPWGGRKNEQGPPDLDELVRKLQNRLGGLFGGGGGGGSSSGFSASSLVTILLIGLVIWALSGIYIIDEGKRGVVLQFGAYKETTMPGPHWYPRFIDSVTKVDVDNVRNVALGSNSNEALMLTQDENIVDVKFSVQYRVSDARAYLFNITDPDLTLRQAAESAVREVVGKSKMDFVLTGGRSEVGARSKALLQKILDRYQTGLEVTTLNMQDAQAPEQVQGAFADAIKAREDEQRKKNEAEAYANDVLPKARGDAASMLEAANGYKERVIADAEGETSRFLKVLAEYEKAPVVTRRRLYLDAMQSVLHNSSKVVIDTKSGNNNLLYLPLDKLMEGRAKGPVAGGGTDASSSSSKSPSSSQSGSTPLRDNLRNREVR